MFAPPFRRGQFFRSARPACSITSPDRPKADRLMREYSDFENIILFTSYLDCHLYVSIVNHFIHTNCVKYSKYTYIRRILVEKDLRRAGKLASWRYTIASTVYVCRATRDARRFKLRRLRTIRICFAPTCAQLHWIHRLPGSQAQSRIRYNEKKWWLLDSAQSTNLSWAFNVMVASYTWLAAPMGHFSIRHEIFR